MRWAEAIHEDTDVDGLVWMSRHWNSQKSLVLFGGRVSEEDSNVVSLGLRVFADLDDFDWLAELGQRMHIQIIPIV